MEHCSEAKKTLVIEPRLDVKTEVTPEGKIIQKMTGQMIEEVLDTKEKQMRAALMGMGWMPPEKDLPVKCYVCDADLEFHNEDGTLWIHPCKACCAALANMKNGKGTAACPPSGNITRVDLSDIRRDMSIQGNYLNDNRNNIRELRKIIENLQNGLKEQLETMAKDIAANRQMIANLEEQSKGDCGPDEIDAINVAINTLQIDATHDREELNACTRRLEEHSAALSNQDCRIVRQEQTTDNLKTRKEEIDRLNSELFFRVQDLEKKMKHCRYDISELFQTDGETRIATEGFSDLEPIKPITGETRVFICPICGKTVEVENVSVVFTDRRYPGKEICKECVTNENKYAVYAKQSNPLLKDIPFKDDEKGNVVQCEECKAPNADRQTKLCNKCAEKLVKANRKAKEELYGKEG